jgi:UDP-glucose 4-epimerase
MFGDGAVVRDYVYIDDVVEALVRAGHTEESSTAFNIGSGKGRSLNDLVAVLQKLLAKPIVIEREPGRPFDVPVSVLDSAKARHELGWSTRVSFEEGVARTLASMAKAVT